MFNPFKNLFKVGRVTPCAPSSPSPTSEAVVPHSSIKNAGPTASPSAGGDLSRLGSGERNLAEPKVAEQPSERARASQRWGEGELKTNSFPLDPDNKRNGKIAKLPRGLRDQINRAFDASQSAVSIARELNKIPEVKTMLEAHFEGRPISPQNLSEWKAGGYRDWQLRQEFILQHEEFAANIHELSQTAEGMANALFGLLLLDYARLMKNKDGETLKTSKRNAKP